MAELDVRVSPMSEMTGDAVTRLAAAHSIVRARRQASGLERELPLPAAGYNGYIRAYRRLGRIVRQADAHNLAPFVISTKGDGLLGAATRQLWAPPQATEVLRLSEYGAELSYWHRDVPHVQAIEIGRAVVSQLTTGRGVYEQANYAWMVTLPGDELKAEVLRREQFEQLALPEVYNLGDAVTEPRQLWVREVAAT